DRPERVRVGDVEIRRAWIVEVRVIEQVEEVGGELGVDPLADIGFLTDAHVHVFVRKARNRSRTAIAPIATQKDGAEFRDVGLIIAEEVVAGPGDWRVQASRNLAGLNGS